MGKIKTVTLVILSVITAVSCSENDLEKRNMDLTMRLDSVERASRKTTSEMEDMYRFLEEISTGLDSIAYQDSVLKNSAVTEKGRGIDRNQIRRNLASFTQVLESQQTKFARIIDSLQMRTGKQVAYLNTIIANLQSQLDEKNKLIASLQADLNKKNITIVQITDKVSELTQTNAHLTGTIEEKEQTISNQTKEMENLNTVYVRIGTKKELKAAGLLEGGLLKKKKINVNDVTQFEKKDRRTLKYLTVNSASAKIITQKPPASSYTMTAERNGKTTVLNIINSEEFWVSKFLIIQTD